MRGNKGDNILFSTSVEVLVGDSLELLEKKTKKDGQNISKDYMFTCTPAALTETQQNHQDKHSGKTEVLAVLSTAAKRASGRDRG